MPQTHFSYCNYVNLGFPISENFNRNRNLLSQQHACMHIGCLKLHTNKLAQYERPCDRGQCRSSHILLSMCSFQEHTETEFLWLFSVLQQNTKNVFFRRNNVQFQIEEIACSSSSNHIQITRKTTSKFLNLELNLFSHASCFKNMRAYVNKHTCCC